MSTFSLLCLMSVETVCYFFILWSPIVSLCCWGVVVVVIVFGIYSYLCNQCIGGEFICSERVGSSCSNSGTRRVNLVTKPVINHERGKDLEVITRSGTYQSLLCLKSVETVCYFFILWSPIVSLCCWGVVVVVIVIGIYSYLCNQCASLQTLLVWNFIWFDHYIYRCLTYLLHVIL
jgi:hypothetical protein